MGSKVVALPVQITQIKSAFQYFITVTYVWEVSVSRDACVSVRGQLWELVLSPLGVLRGWDSSHPRLGSKHLYLADFTGSEIFFDSRHFKALEGKCVHYWPLNYVDSREPDVKLSTTTYCPIQGGQFRVHVQDVSSVLEQK